MEWKVTCPNSGMPSVEAGSSQTRLDSREILVRFEEDRGLLADVLGEGLDEEMSRVTPLLHDLLRELVQETAPCIS
jgi:hypothetical protein